MSNKEDVLKKSLIAFEKAKQRMERAQKAYRDEVDAIILKPARAREITRDQAVKLANAIENEETFQIIMEMNPLYPVNRRSTEQKEREGDLDEI